MIACNDDACPGLRSSLTFAASAGTEYAIRVSGFAGQRGVFTLTLDAAAPLTAGDICGTALSITISGTGGGNYTTFDNSGCAGACIGSVDEWLVWTAPSNGVVHATTCAGDTNFDTTLAAYSGSCGSLTPIACNDDAEPFCNGQLTSRIEWTAVAGTTYLLRVAGFGGATGQYDIEIGYDNACPADIAPSGGGNGMVDVDDLIAVILAWGPCSGCAEDFVPPGGDGQVDVDDLIGVILAWGACP